MTVHTITQKENGIRLMLSLSDVLVIRLPENPTTGFKWVLHPEPDFLVDEEFEPGDPGVPGSKGQVIFTVRPKRTGVSSQFFLELKQPWVSKSSAVDEFNCSISVK